MGAELLCNERYNDVHHTLVGGICLYKGEPVIVNASDQHRVQVSHLKDGFLVETVDYRTKEFRYNSPPLGYFNSKDRALYMQRSAKETSHHALRADYMIVLPEGSIERLYDEEPDWFMSKAMASCIKGEHPSFAEVLEVLREDQAESRAFHRNYALKRKTRGVLSIVKRGLEEVGLVKENKVVVFDSRYKSTIETITRGVEIDVTSL